MCARRQGYDLDELALFSIGWWTICELPVERCDYDFPTCRFCVRPVCRLQTLAEDGMTYARALSKLANTSVIAPSYVIIGGIGPGEGAVITRGRDKAIDVWHLNAADHR